MPCALDCLSCASTNNVYMMTKRRGDQKHLYKYQIWAHLSKLRFPAVLFLKAGTP